MSLDIQAYQPQGLWPVVWKLLRLRVLISLRNFRRARRRQKIAILALAVFILLFLGFVFFLSWTFLGFLKSPQFSQLTGQAGPFLENTPALILGGAFLGILLTSFGVLLQALYLAGDMDFLLSAPLPIRAVFLSKLLQAILPNLGLISLFALPVLFGLGAANQYHFLYYPLIVVLLAALALAAAGISSLLVMVTVRIFPARRVAEVLGFIGAVASFLCSQTGQLARWNSFDMQQADQALSLFNRFNQPWSPLAWAGRGLVEIGKQNWVVGIGLFGLTLALAGLIFAVALVTAERLYYTGWAGMQNVQRRKKAARPSRPTGQTLRRIAFMGVIPSPVRAIFMKDLLVLRRDLRNMSQLVTPLIIGIIYAVMLLRNGDQPPAGRGEAPAWFMEVLGNMMVYANVGLSLFVGWMLLGRLAGMGFSQEGRNYWLVKSAPVRAAQLMAAKFLVAYLPVLGLSWVFMLITWLLKGADLASLLFSLAVIALCTAGNAGLNLTFGILGANLAWEDPRQMQRTSSGCIGAIASMIYLPACLVLFFGPPLAGAALGLPVYLGQAAGVLLGGAFSLGCAAAPPWFVSKRVERLGEE